MRADIFPDLDLPVIYVAQPYGGMSPAQMEGYITYYYEYHFLYINGIESVESKSIQNTGAAEAHVSSRHRHGGGAGADDRVREPRPRVHAAGHGRAVRHAVRRRHRAGRVSGVLAARRRSLGEIQDLALNRVRPQFATLPGSDLAAAVRRQPAHDRDSRRSRPAARLRHGARRGDSRRHDRQRDHAVGQRQHRRRDADLADQLGRRPKSTTCSSCRSAPAPARRCSSATSASVSDSTDIPTAYALVNGRRAVYIPVTKRPDASTLTVVSEVKANLGAVPGAGARRHRGVATSSTNRRTCRQRCSAVVREALLGALLTGLMVLLFLRDWRSAAIVVVTIPFALLAAVVALWGAGQTINIMTLGGLALAVGILVDEATVAIENIHTHLARGAPLARGGARCERRGRRAATAGDAVGRRGVRAVVLHDRRLAVAVRAAVARGRLRDDRVVPAVELARAGACRSWLLRRGIGRRGAARDDDWVDRLRDRLAALLERLAPARVAGRRSPISWSTVGVVAAVGADTRSRDFPPSGVKAFQLRFRAPAGTKFEATERLAPTCST